MKKVYITLIVLLFSCVVGVSAFASGGGCEPSSKYTFHSYSSDCVSYDGYSSGEKDDDHYYDGYSSGEKDDLYYDGYSSYEKDGYPSHEYDD